MVEQIPITTSLLTWARERAGMSRAEASRKFKHFEDWEEGLSYPSYPQLEQLSEALRVPIAVFFFPEPPAVPPITETFRTLPNSEIEKLPSRARMLLRKAKSLQLNLGELTANHNHTQRLITKDLSFLPTVVIAEMATAVREYIGVSILDQQQWKDDATALKEWRSALYRVGVYVFKDAFKLDDFSGFCLYDDIFPIIYVNNSSTKTRQMFTYFHELAHLLFHTSGIDTIKDAYIPRLAIDAQQIEVLCNRFAAHFLLPDDAFAQAVGSRPVSEETAELLASKFHVSREVIFRRFLDQGRIQERQYKAAVAHWNEQRQSGGGAGGDHYWTKLSYLGRDYVSLALSQYYQHRIDEYQLAEYLDTKPKNISTLEEYFGRGFS